MLTIFLSSTERDLLEERNAIEQQIKRLQQIYIGMEYFPASDKTPLKTALSKLRKADVVILVIAHIYGSIVPDQKISFVEAEYRKAQELSIPTLIYFKDKSTLVLPEHVEQSPKLRKKLVEFKKKLNKLTRGRFRNPDDLAAKVSADLTEYLFEKKQWGNALHKEIGKYRDFWNAFEEEPLAIVMEAGEQSAHTGDLGYSKDINGALGLYELILSLNKIGLKYKIKNSLDKYLNKKAHLLLDGGHIGNEITKDVINHDEVSKRLVFRNAVSKDGYKRWIKDVRNVNKRYLTEYEKGREMYPGGPKKQITYDYGFLAKIGNPYERSKICLIASGNHGAGTYACMKVLSEPKLLNKIIDEAKKKDFQAVIGIHPSGLFQFEEPEIKEVVILNKKKPKV